MSTLTDTQRLEWLLAAIDLGGVTEEQLALLSPQELLAEKERGEKIGQGVEALEAGLNLGLRGRELIDSAMNAVRFDEVGVEKSTQIVQAMIDERTDTELLDFIQRWSHLGSFQMGGDENGVDLALYSEGAIICESSAPTLREAVVHAQAAIENNGAENGGIGS